LSQGVQDIASNESHLGLLQGIEDIRSAKYFTQNLDIWKAVEMLENSRYIYNAALRDCEMLDVSINDYLQSCYSKAKSFYMSREVWDREDLMNELYSVSSEEGNFVCLLGGKDIGKSLVLNSMVNNSETPMIYVDLREHGSNVETAIYTELTNMPTQLRNVNSFFTRESTISLLSTFSNAMLNINVSELLKTFDIETPNKRFANLLKSIAYPNGLTVVIDEANIAFNVNKESDIILAQNTMRLFTTLTKQNNVV
jgi:hypothetical protein